MNKKLLAIIAILTVTISVMVPVLARDNEVNAAAGKCGSFMKFDRKSKSCLWKI